jgi:predicted DNA-binding transcriptional regulator AlpA
MPDSDYPLLAKDAAAAVGISLAAFWRAVRDGRLPQPVYPLPRAPRWFRSELRAALQHHRMSPVAAKEQRRMRRLAREAALPSG